MTKKPFFKAKYRELKQKSEWTKANIREQFFNAEMLLEEAKQENDSEFIMHWKELLLQIEQKMTPDQFSLEMDDFSECSPELHKELYERVKQYEADGAYGEV